jgi:RNA polymerase sigma-70 factor (ECF subfamily)
MYGTAAPDRADGRIEEGGHPMRWAEPDRDDGFDLREVVVEHRADIFRYARSFCHCDADAEDLAQTAVLRALTTGSEVRNPERAKWYLLRIVRNLATDEARIRARMAVEPRAELPDPVSAEPALDERLLRVDDHELPRAAFADLAPAHQEILRLRFVEELDHATIAERLHTTEHAARQRLYRAMQALRAIARQGELGADGPP